MTTAVLTQEDTATQIGRMFSRWADIASPTSTVADAVGRALACAGDDAEIEKLRNVTSSWARATARETTSDAREIAAFVTALIDAYLVQSAEAGATSAGKCPAVLSKQVLIALRGLGPSSPSRIADELTKARPQVSKVLGVLSGHGLVVQERDTLDGRARVFSITEAGAAVLAGASRPA